MTRSPRVLPRRKPRQSRAQATCDVILTATARVLIKDGYEAASTNRIAQEAGVSIGSLYQYYPSKEGLVLAVLERYHAQGVAGVEAELVRLAEEPLPVVIKALVRHVLATKAENPQLHRMLVEQLPRLRQHSQVDPYTQRLFRLLRAFLEPRAREIRPSNLDMAVFVLVHAVEALTHAAVTDRPEYLNSEAFADELSELALNYLRPEPAQASAGRLRAVSSASARR
ncbi:TetR/AcrR family transcriptional regulator [Hyalangium versicolor]|uniref:TetR/AcrR family transcriptional regulator n=1 Tax=Hyalangium versicolor TaxID=2861190 RepID=UPI001CCA91B5|nr:TetR/AcrR family transcriptional regulator [Hyalangium versicolor]